MRGICQPKDDNEKTVKKDLRVGFCSSKPLWISFQFHLFLKSERVESRSPC